MGLVSDASIKHCIDYLYCTNGMESFENPEDYQAITIDLYIGHEPLEYLK